MAWKRWLFLSGLGWCAGYLIAAGCGSIAEAPTISIPAPIVTKVTISNPQDGVVTITGTAGAVTGGNVVRAQNLTREGVTFRWERLLWGIAYAATTAQTTAAGDGSFSLELEASIGDRIRLTQIDADGNSSTTAQVTAPYQPLSLGFTPTDIAVDPDSDTAYIVGTSGGNGVAVPLTFGAAPALGTTITLPTECNTPTALAVDGARDRLIVVDHTNRTVCSQATNGTPGTALAALTVTPINIAIDAATATAVITNDSAAADVEVSLLLLATDTFVPVTLTNPVGGAVQTGTPSVAAAQSGGIDYAMVVTTYTGDQHYGFLINLQTQALIGAGTALSIGTPRELRLYSGARALLADANGRAQLLSIDTAGGTITPSTTLTVGTNPLGTDIDTTNLRGFVANRTDNTLSVLNLNASPETVTTTFDVAADPIHLAYRAGTANQLAIIHTDGTLIVLAP